MKFYPEEDIKKVEEVLGKPLPKINSIYFDGAKIWEKMPVHQVVTPYFLSKVFTEEEMTMVCALPGNSVSVSKTTGIDEKRCEEVLHNLYQNGRILTTKKYSMDEKEGFTPVYSHITFAENIVLVLQKRSIDYCTIKDAVLLSLLWIDLGEVEQADIDGASRYARIIPKWNSIKNIPGVMPSENMHEIFLENFNDGTLAWQRCVCRARKNLINYGKSDLEEGCHCQSGLVEHDNTDGHCLWFKDRVKYMSNILGCYIPTTLEEVEKRFNECEFSTTIYGATNKREVTNCCVCCGDCCYGAYNYYKHGIDQYYPSRFGPEVSEDKCVGCKVCTNHCLFNAISYNENGKCEINPDKCKGCGNCVLKCPTKALKMKVVHDIDWIPEF